MSVPHRQGRVRGNDGLQHAAQVSLLGLVAICGAGFIVSETAGRFQPEDDVACPACADIIEDGVPRSSEGDAASV